MHDRIDVNNITVAAIFSALGIAFPALFHLIGAGQVFLPMYLPLAVGAYMLKEPYALMAGFFTPLVSSFLTGMPPLVPPTAPAMAVQLGFMCLAISFLTHRLRLRLMVTLILALVFERVLMISMNILVMPLFGVNPHVVSFYDLARGLPGIALLFAVTPLAVPRCIALINRYSLRLYERKEHEHEA